MSSSYLAALRAEAESCLRLELEKRYPKLSKEFDILLTARERAAQPSQEQRRSESVDYVDW